MFCFTFRLKSLLKLLLCVAFLLMLVLNPEQASASAKEGFNISMYLVLPSLFPFAVISSYICSNFSLPNFLTKSLSELFSISRQSVPLLVFGIVSGYPVGAGLIADAVKDKRISVKEAEHLLPFANAAGPLFLTSVAGAGMFGSIHIGCFLYATHLLSILIVLLLSKPFAPQKSRPENTFLKRTPLIRCIDKSMSAMLNVMGCIAFFSVLTRMLSETIILKGFPLLSAILKGFAELTTGLNRLALCDLPLRLKISITSFLCGFSGLCILLQVSNAVKDLKLSLKKYILSKLMIAFLSFALSWLAFPFIPITVPTFSGTAPESFNFIFQGYGFILLILPLYKFIKTKASFFDKW